MGEPLLETGAVHVITTELTFTEVVGAAGFAGTIAHSTASYLETAL